MIYIQGMYFNKSVTFRQTCQGFKFSSRGCFSMIWNNQTMLSIDIVQRHDFFLNFWFENSIRESLTAKSKIKSPTIIMLDITLFFVSTCI